MLASVTCSWVGAAAEACPGSEGLDSCLRLEGWDSWATVELTKGIARTRQNRNTRVLFTESSSAKERSRFGTGRRVRGPAKLLSEDQTREITSEPELAKATGQ